MAEDKLTEVATRLSAAEATWEMAENLYRQLADQVREHAYILKILIVSFLLCTTAEARNDFK